MIGVAPQRTDRRQHVGAAGHDQRSRAVFLSFLPCHGRSHATNTFIPSWIAPTWFRLPACMELPAKACRPFTCSRTSPTAAKPSTVTANCSTTFRKDLFFTTPEGRFIEVNDALVDDAGLFQPGRAPAGRYSHPGLSLARAARASRCGHAGKRGGAQPRGHAAPQGRFPHLCPDQCLWHVRQCGAVAADSRLDARHHRPANLSIGTAARARFLRQDSQQHPEPHSGRRHRGVVSYANRRWHEAGFEQSEVLAARCWNWPLPATSRALSDALQATLRGGQVDNLELQICAANGHAGQFSVNLSPMRDEQGNITSIVVVMTDITDSAESARQAGARRKNGGGRAIGLRRGSRSEQSSHRDSRFRRSAHGESRDFRKVLAKICA